MLIEQTVRELFEDVPCLVHYFRGAGYCLSHGHPAYTDPPVLSEWHRLALLFADRALAEDTEDECLWRMIGGHPVCLKVGHDVHGEGQPKSTGPGTPESSFAKLDQRLSAVKRGYEQAPPGSTMHVATGSYKGDWQRVQIAGDAFWKREEDGTVRHSGELSAALGVDGLDAIQPPGHDVVRATDLGAKLVHEKAAGGSQGAQWYKDKATGDRYVVKGLDFEDQNRVSAEALAGAVYKRLGVPVPDTQIVTIGEKRGYASKQVPGDLHADVKANKDLAKGFMADVFTANRDVTGMDYDNLIFPKDGGGPVRVDLGGTFVYRAQGGAKEYNTSPTEHKSLLDPKVNPASARAFGYISTSAMRKQAKAMAAKLTDAWMEKAVASAQFPDPHIADSILNGMKTRREWLRKVAYGEVKLDEPHWDLRMLADEPAAEEDCHWVTIRGNAICIGGASHGGHYKGATKPPKGPMPMAGAKAFPLVKKKEPEDIEELPNDVGDVEISGALFKTIARGAIAKLIGKMAAHERIVWDLKLGDPEWDESEHPRDEEGKFANKGEGHVGGGGEDVGGPGSAPAASTEASPAHARTRDWNPPQTADQTRQDTLDKDQKEGIAAVSKLIAPVDFDAAFDKIKPGAVVTFLQTGEISGTTGTVVSRAPDGVFSVHVKDGDRTLTMEVQPKQIKTYLPTPTSPPVDRVALPTRNAAEPEHWTIADPDTEGLDVVVLGNASDYRKTADAARELQEARTAEIANDRGLKGAYLAGKFGPGDAKGISDTIWREWKSDSGSIGGIALQLAASEELGAHFRSTANTQPGVEGAPKAWAQVGPDDREKTQEAYFSKYRDSYYDSEVENWRENLEDDVTSRVSDDEKWGRETLRGILEEEGATPSSIGAALDSIPGWSPETISQWAAGAKGSFSQNYVHPLFPEDANEKLPGVDVGTGFDAAKAKLLAAYKDAFKEKVDEMVSEEGDNPPSYLEEQANESMQESWNEIDPEDKFKFFKDHVYDEDEYKSEKKIPNEEAAKAWADRNLPGGFEGLRAYVRATWETTQTILNKSGHEELTVYRGLMLSRDQVNEGRTQLVPETDEEKAALIKTDPETGEQVRTKGTLLPDLKLYQNGAASFTLDPSVANGWNGIGDNLPPDPVRVVLKARVPATAVLSLPPYGANLAGESEVVVIGTPWKHWEAWLDKAPRGATMDLNPEQAQAFDTAVENAKTAKADAASVPFHAGDTIYSVNDETQTAKIEHIQHAMPASGVMSNVSLKWDDGTVTNHTITEVKSMMDQGKWKKIVPGDEPVKKNSGGFEEPTFQTGQKFKTDSGTEIEVYEIKTTETQAGYAHVKVNGEHSAKAESVENINNFIKQGFWTPIPKEGEYYTVKKGMAQGEVWQVEKIQSTGVVTFKTPSGASVNYTPKEIASTFKPTSGPPSVKAPGGAVFKAGDTITPKVGDTEKSWKVTKTVNNMVFAKNPDTGEVHSYTPTEAAALFKAANASNAILSKAAKLPHQWGEGTILNIPTGTLGSTLPDEATIVKVDPEAKTFDLLYHGSTSPIKVTFDEAAELAKESSGQPAWTIKGFKK